ncbi:Uncharacterised protein [uncultured archaeon]|nr:Uncharacterised protein [uncultured archaeon]
MCGDLRCTVLAIITMLGICILTGMASAGSNLKIEASVKPCVEVVVSPDDCTWVLAPKAPGYYTKTGKLSVRSNANWTITAKEDGATGGYLTEWKENSYASKKLSTPMKIRAGEEVTLTTGAQTPITAGTRTGSQPKEVDFAFTQIVTAQDLASSGESAYKMVVTFIGMAA